MNLNVLYTPYSRETLQAVYVFIVTKFGLRSGEKFLAEVEETVKLIASNPFMFKASDIDDHVRIAFVARQCSLFYRVTETVIHMLYFWDNRQEPFEAKP